MTKKGMNPNVDAYLSRAKRWQAEMEELRRIVLDCPLVEEFKWGKPCYTYQGNNVVLMVPFKEYCALLFGKGALLKDVDGILIKPTENTQAARRIHFTDARKIVEMEPVLKAYIQEAIEVETAGLEVSYKKKIGRAHV